MAEKKAAPKKAAAKKAAPKKAAAKKAAAKKAAPKKAKLNPLAPWLGKFTVTSPFFPLKLRFHKLSDPPPAKCSNPFKSAWVFEDSPGSSTGHMNDYISLDRGWRYRVSIKQLDDDPPTDMADWAYKMTIEVPEYGEPIDLDNNMVTGFNNPWDDPVDCTSALAEASKKKAAVKKAPAKKTAAKKK